MTLIKIKNGSPALAMHRMPYNGLLNEFFENSVLPEFRKWTSPAVNLASSDSGYEIQVAAPGLSKNDFQITLDGENLTIRTEKNKEKEERENYTSREFDFGSFTRSFKLPENVNTDQINAVYEDGILKISLPKRAEEAKKVRAISIQ